jgi:peptide/nickel transport system permease protein
MAKYILKRLLQTVVVMVIVAVVTFFLTSMMPGDPVIAVTGGEQTLTSEQYDKIYHELLLDKPVVERFGIWAWNALHLDFGTSYTYSAPVWQVIASRIPVTLYLSFLALIISVPIGVLFGILTAVKRGTKTDTIITMLSNITMCLPQFWIAIVLMFIFGMKLGWLPSYGLDWSWNVGFGEHIKHLVLPLFCLAIGGIAGFTRQTRSSILEVIRQDYVRTAWSKGLNERRVIMKHTLKNGLVPIITILGNRLAIMIGGTMFVENVFTIPGMGTLIVRSVQSRDIPTIQALVLVTSFICCVVFILTDLMYAAVDPRIRLTSEAGN